MGVPRQLAVGLIAVGGVLVASAGTAGQVEAAGEGAGGEASVSVVSDPAVLVSSMSRALRLLDYEGTFVHIQGGHVSSMHILHSSDEDGELERMVSLDGEAREVIRDHSLVTCIWPDSGSVVVSKATPRKLLPEIDVSLADNESYSLEHAGTDRVAGVSTEVVAIIPHDDQRYGYRFWIDSETHMLLRSKLLDGARIVEQVLFTRIEYPEHIDRSRFEFRPGVGQLGWIEARSTARGEDSPGARATSGMLSGGRASKVAPDGAPAAAVVSSSTSPITSAEEGEGTEGGDRVRFEGLPSGYVELSESYRPMPLDPGAGGVAPLAVPGGGAPVSHVMVSDGMASVSVYVEHLDAEAQDKSVAGLSSMGAVNAYGLSLDAGFVTAVGEVPPTTVRRIAEAVRLGR